MLFGCEKACAESDWRRRLGYQWLGELHIPGRLRIWHLMKELRRLDLWTNRPLTVLDAGGGEGAFAYFLARKFPAWRIVVADNEEKTLERGRKIKATLNLHNLEVRSVDLCALNEENVYDVVICSDVLEHIEQDDLVVSGLARTLKPQGVILITSPSVPQPKHLSLVAWRERRIGFSPTDYGHVRQGYSHDRLLEMLENAKLNVDRIRWTFGRFGALMFDLFFITGDNKPYPIVFAALFPFYMFLSVLDVVVPIRHGAAILGVGRKL